MDFGIVNQTEYSKVAIRWLLWRLSASTALTPTGNLSASTIPWCGFYSGKQMLGWLNLLVLTILAQNFPGGTASFQTLEKFFRQHPQSRPK